MPSESLRDTPPQQDLLSATEKSDAGILLTVMQPSFPSSFQNSASGSPASGWANHLIPC
jgi:hypothetical protein